MAFLAAQGEQDGINMPSLSIYLKHLNKLSKILIPWLSSLLQFRVSKRRIFSTSKCLVYFSNNPTSCLKGLGTSGLTPSNLPPRG